MERDDSPPFRQIDLLSNLQLRLGPATRKFPYGENPHQQAAFFAYTDTRPGALKARQLQGKELTYNNVLDADAALDLVAEFSPEKHAAVAIIKHASPCSVALADTLEEAYRKALKSDRESAYGGVIALNKPLDNFAANFIRRQFKEVVIAPGVEPGAAMSLAVKQKDLRLLITDRLPDPRAPGYVYRSVNGGLLVQTRDNVHIDDLPLTVASTRAPSEAELDDMRFAMSVCKHVRSNAVVYAKDGVTLGIGGGQMSRVVAARLASVKKMQAGTALGLKSRHCVAASDGFLPFADGLIEMVEKGHVTALIQPGGSKRDAEVLDAANQRGVAVVFTGYRHFKH